MAEKFYAMYTAKLDKITQSWHIADNPGVEYVKPGMPGVTVGQ